MPTTDEEFLAAFEGRTLTPAEWHHRDHLRVAWLYLERWPLDEAIARIGRGIRALNAHFAVPEALDRGYHETLTQLWMRLLHGLREAVGREDSFEAFLDRHPYLLNRFLGRLYYSRERILTEKAKREFVEPDLAPFPSRPAPPR